MGFGIRPGMSCWNEMDEKYKKEYHIFAAKAERKKFENDRKLRQKNIPRRKKIFAGLNKNANITEKNWFAWMEY